MNPHEYNPFGGSCRNCGKNLYHEEHFGGDRKAAAAAYHAAKAEQGRVGMFRNGLQTGVRIVARDDHPRDDIAGRNGVVVAVEKATETAMVRFDPDKQGNVLEVGVPIRYLLEGKLPRPPQFASVEEAEEWMKEHAPEMGVVLPNLPPQFSSTQEADDWLRQQVGEPYVPPQWEPDRTTNAVMGHWDDYVARSARLRAARY